MELTPGTRVMHDRYGEGIVSRVQMSTCEIFFEKTGKVSISKQSDELSVVEKGQDTGPAIHIDVMELEKMFERLLSKAGIFPETIDMGEKWQGGTLLLQPADSDLKPKEIPMEVFFHKIVMIRDRLRVLEQNINSSNKLNDEEKVNLQQYITRAYGSLTTFNLLFKDKEDYFKGSTGEK